MTKHLQNDKTTYAKALRPVTRAAAALRMTLQNVAAALFRGVVRCVHRLLYGELSHQCGVIAIRVLIDGREQADEVATRISACLAAIETDGRFGYAHVTTERLLDKPNSARDMLLDGMRHLCRGGSEPCVKPESARRVKQHISTLADQWEDDKLLVLMTEELRYSAKEEVALFNYANENDVRLAVVAFEKNGGRARLSTENLHYELKANRSKDAESKELVEMLSALRRS